MIGVESMALTLALACAPQDPATALLQLPAGTRVTDATMVDLDADGRLDLVLAGRTDATDQRSLQLHLRQSEGPAFVATPSLPVIPIDRDVVAFTFVDCLPGAGPELILMTGEQLALLVRAADGTSGYRRLAAHRLVWPAADGALTVPLRDAAVDLDADGRADLLLPGPDGWEVLFQDRDGDEPRFERRAGRTLPPWQSAISRAVERAGLGSRVTLGRRLGDGLSGRPGGSGPLVEVSQRTPPCQVVDIDGDGRLDLVMHRNGRMFAACQRQPGQLEAVERDLPLPPDRLTLADPAFDVQFADLNGDGRIDLVLTTSARRDDDIESRVDLFLAGADGSWADKSDNRLRLQALAAPPQLVDVDGDGRRDLACLSLRTSAMRDFTGATASALDAQLSLFRNDGSQFVRPPLLTQPLPLAAGEDRLAPPFLLVRPGSDGRPGDVVLHIDGGIERRALEIAGERLRLGAATGRVAMPAAQDRRTRIVAVDPAGADLLILNGAEVRHVRFE